MAGLDKVSVFKNLNKKLSKFTDKDPIKDMKVLLRNRKAHMKNFLQSFSVILFSIASIGCASSILKVESEPAGAEVYISQANRPAIKIGQTPLSIEESKLATGVEPFQITISRDGYLNEHILVPHSTLNRNTSIAVRLKGDMSKLSQSGDQLDKVASATALTQHLIRIKDFDRAEQNLLSYTTLYPSVATFHELLGNVYYLRREYNRALSSYRQAESLNPKNNDTRIMIERLQAMKKEDQ